MNKYFVSILFLLIVGTSHAQKPKWAFNIGSTTDDFSYECKVGSNGNVVMGGQFTGTMDLDPGPGVFNVTSNGKADLFLACYTSNGNFIWGFSVGGTSQDAVYSMAIDKNNDIIIVGWFNGTNIDFDPGPGSFLVSDAGGCCTTLPYGGDGYIAKYSSTGAFMWAKDLGGNTMYDYSQGIATDAVNNIYVGGVFNNTMFVSTSITLNAGAAGKNYLIKYNPSGTVIWAHNFGGGPDGETRTIAVHGRSVYIGGFFTGTSNFDPWGPPAIYTSIGYNDAFIAKYDTSGTFKWVTPIVGSGTDDDVGSLMLDDTSNIYIGGWTSSPTITFNPLSPGTSTVTTPGGGGTHDAYIAKYDSNGLYRWANVMGAAGEDLCRGVALESGSLYATGEFHNTVDFDPATPIANLVSNGGYDIFITKYDLDGNYVCGFNIGSSIDDIGYHGLAFDSGYLYATGQFGGIATDFDPSVSTFPLTSNGGTDAYLVKYSWNTAVVLNGYIVGDTICNSGSPANLTVFFTSGGPGPFDITFSDGTTTFTKTGVISGTPVTLPVSPSITTTYYITSIIPSGGALCIVPSLGIFGTAKVVVGSPVSIPLTGTLVSCSTFNFSAPAGGSSYNWSFGDGTFGTANPVTHAYSGLGPFNVVLSFTSTYGCLSKDSITVTVYPSPIAITDSSINCNTFAFSSPSGGSSYNWSFGDGTYSTAMNVTHSYSVPGTFKVILSYTSSSGCISKDSLTVTVPTIAVTFTETLISCNKSSFSAPTGGIYNWTFGDGYSGTSNPITHSFAGSGPFNVVLSYTNSSGCKGKDSMMVTYSGGSPFTYTKINCNTFSFVADSGTSYTWDFGDGVTSNANPVTHTYYGKGPFNATIKYTTLTGCAGADAKLITPDGPIKVNIGPDLSFCGDKTVTLQPSATYTDASYLWNTGKTSSSIDVSTTNSYWLAVTFDGCTVSDTALVRITPFPTINLGPDTTLCEGKEITLSPTQPGVAQYLWSDGSTGPSLHVSAAGVYKLTVTLYGCSADTSITITPLKKPEVALGPDTTLCFGELLLLQVADNTPNALWSNKTIGKSIKVSEEGTYSVSTSNSCGIVTDSINVRYELCDIWFPNAFTPNGDGKNDIARSIGAFDKIRDYTLAIFNRFGQEVFMTTDVYAGWDGLLTGVPQDLGVYYYYINYTLNGRKGFMKGDLTLIR
ncbi:MAG: hypothetical protein JWQ38_855 [Flavipsychrobacter sp.]|nr:hypothetical protein [Flavipsychrobacter sp.]